MVYKGFVSGTYPARSYAVSIDRLVNWYPEIVESQLGKSQIAYYPTPGLILVVDTSNLGGAGRGMFALDGRQWAVIGSWLVEFHPDGTVEEYAGLVDDGKPVSIVANSRTPTQLMIASAGRGYIFDSAALTLTPLAGDFEGASQVAFLDQYLIALTPDSSQFQISDLNDGTSWSALDISINVASADKVKAIMTDHEYLYLMGSKRIAVYVNSGNPDFPIVPVPGAFIEMGIRAPFSLQRIDNTLMWYGENEHGAGVVYRAEGFIPKRVSTHAIETVWSQYGKDDDAIAFTQQRDGHTFYRLTFPAADQTWVYDLATDMWHERAVWDSANAAWHAQTQRFGCYATGGTFGRYFVCGADGKIYLEDNYTFTEDGRLIRRVRIAPVLANENKLVFPTRLEIVIEPGVGLDGDPAAQGANPLMTLRYSPDSGRTWSNEMYAPAGLHGASDTQVVFDALGSGRAWVPEISVTDPVNWVIVGANIELKTGKR